MRSARQRERYTGHHRVSHLLHIIDQPISFGLDGLIAGSIYATLDAQVPLDKRGLSCMPLCGAVCLASGKRAREVTWLGGEAV